MLTIEIIKPVPIEYFGIKLVAYLASDHKLYINLKDLCKQVGMSYSAQQERNKRNWLDNEKFCVKFRMDVPFIKNYNGLVKKEILFVEFAKALILLMTMKESRCREGHYPFLLMLKKHIADATGEVFYQQLCDQLLSKLESLVC